jgi:hypothetical protein
MVRDKPLDTLALDAVLEIGCPAPLLPHHVTITASITDRSMNPGHLAPPVTHALIHHPPMTEGVLQRWLRLSEQRLALV